jgi:hypothetical protein
MGRGRQARNIAILAGLGVTLAGAAGIALAQENDQQIRCMQLQQELTAAKSGGGRDDLPGIEQQIAQNQRILQGTEAVMQDAGCFESFFIFGRGLVRSPKCLKMNDRMEDARHQLDVLQGQRDAIMGGGGNKRRQAELMDALARNGCSGGQPRPAAASRGGGGLFDWFGRGGGSEEEQQQTEQEPGSDGNISRSINPNAPYRTVCVRLCDGFFYPISYSTYASHFQQDVAQCQRNCAAPAELYVYRNPGGDIDTAISLNGSPYRDLPVAFKYRKSYTPGCSCKEAEYNPTEIEQANKKTEAQTGGKPGKRGAKTASAAPAKPPAAKPSALAAQPAPDAAQGAAPQQQLNLDITGATAGNAAPR